MDLTRSVPPEILSMVFVLLRDSGPTTSTEWLSVTAVCRRWRGIALLAPFLWSRIHIDHRRPWPPDTVVAFFDRSGTVDLDIDVAFDDSICAAMTQTLLLHASRIKSLSLDHRGCRHSHCPEVQPVLQGLGPKLVSLSLIGSRYWLGPSVVSLRSLYMVESKVALRGRLDILTYLELQDIDDYNSHEELYDHLSQVLQFCPNLATLAILDMAWLHAIDAEEGMAIVPYQLPCPRLQTLRMRDQYKDLPAMVGALLVPSHVSVHIEAQSLHWKDWACTERPRPFKEMLFGSMGQTSPVSLLPFDRFVLTVGAEHHLAEFAAFTASSDELPRRSIKIVTNPAYANSKKDFSRLAKVLLEDLVALSTVLKPSVLEVHLADHVGPTSLLSLLLAWYPTVQRLAIGGTHGSNQFIQNLFQPDALRLREAFLCAADASQLDVATLVDRINRRAERPAYLFLRRLVICLRPDDAGLTLDAFASLPSQVCVEITRGCPVCHRVATPEEVKLFRVR